MGLEDVMANGIGFVVLIIVVFSVVLVVVNQYATVSNYNTSGMANLSGSSFTLAQQTPLLVVLAFIFVPAAAMAIMALKMIG